MQRFRRWFLVFALALLAPVALLVERALHNVGLERQVRHQAVAERVFDEMERSLSRFLEPEESRPFEDFLNQAFDDSATFVVGYFQLDPDGHVQARPTGGAGDVPDIENLVLGFWRNDLSNRPAPKPVAQLPGTTVPLAKGEADKPAASRDQAAGAVSAFDALRTLNKAASERLERQRKLDEYETREPEQAQAPPASKEKAVGGKTQEHPEEASHAKDYLPPLAAELVAPQRLLLYRTVVRGAQGYRQGMLLDLNRLCGWLRKQAIGDEELAGYTTLRCSTPLSSDSAPVAKDDQLAYQHRFADPFDAITARLALRPLPGVGSVIYIYALSGLLLLTGTLGLAALYRMVSVVVHYAEQRSNFVAAVSHELKTPLTAIRMYAEMLRDGLVPSEAKRDEYHRHITAEAERLTRLINNVLELSRLEKGNREMALAVGAVEPVVQEVSELLRPHLSADGFALIVDADANLPPLRFERDALIQVLTNLVDNAAKYARQAADKRIELRCSAREGRVLVTVRDHGPGVSPRHLERIFDPFYRGESELTRRNKGTGIGLALVRGLAERMGARVTARNHPEGGLEVAISWDAEST